MNITRILGPLLAVSIASMVLADETPTPGTGPFYKPLFDSQQWSVVQATSASFGKKHPDVWVQLLKSIVPVGKNVFGEPTYAVNVLVSDGESVIYSFVPVTIPPDPVQWYAEIAKARDRLNRMDYIDDQGLTAAPLEVRDVTGDGVPEIIFHAGAVGATDFFAEI